jgi:L-threonylcarbamoyladenylate synthase
MAWAEKIIARGGVLIFPTETFYGIGGDPWLPETVARIYRIKGRAAGKPLPLIAADLEAARRAVALWPGVAERLARSFWPGPLSMVLPASDALPAAVSAGTRKVAVRVSSHAAARRLAAAAGGLITATSANFSGHPPCTHAGEMPAELLAMVDGLLDAGKTAGGKPSTLIEVSGDSPRLLRPGTIPWEQLARFL